MNERNEKNERKAAVEPRIPHPDEIYDAQFSLARQVAEASKPRTSPQAAPSAPLSPELGIEDARQRKLRALTHERSVAAAFGTAPQAAALPSAPLPDVLGIDDARMRKLRALDDAARPKQPTQERTTTVTRRRSRAWMPGDEERGEREPDREP